MITIEQLKQLHGQDVNQTTLNEIKHKMRLTVHSIEKMKNRFPELVVERFDNKVDFRKTINNICDKIDKNILAYYNTDGSINVAINRWEYFVFAYNEDRDTWSLVTFKEKSLNSNDIFNKKQLALEGYDRKY